MKLVKNARRVLLRSWSLWAGGYLALLWLLVPEVLFGLFGVEMSPLLVWGVAFLLASLAPILRILDQGGLD